MARLTYDASDVEAGGGGTQPEPAMYNGKIASITPRKKKSDGTPCNDLEVVVDVGQEYARQWTYIPLNADATNKWKLREFTDALGLPPKGTFPDFKTLVNKPVLVKIVADTDQNNDYRGRIKNLFLPGSQEATAPSSPASTNGDGGGTTDQDYDAWDDQDIKDELQERGLAVAGRYSKQKGIDRLRESDQGGDGDGDGDAADDGGDAGNASLLNDLAAETVAELNTDPAHYAEWSDEDVKAFVEEDLGIGGNLTGRKNRQKYVEAIVAFAADALGGDGGDAGGDGEAAIEDNYDDASVWGDQDLKDEISERNEGGAEITLSGRWTRAKAIEALREDNVKAAAEPF